MADELSQQELETALARALRAAAMVQAGQAAYQPQPNPLTLPRWYETTALDDKSGAAFRVVTLPPDPTESARRELGTPLDEIARRTADELGLSVYMEVSAEDLVDSLLATRPDVAVTYDGERLAEDLRNWTLRQRTSKTAGLREFGGAVVAYAPGLLSFAERVATEPLIPVEGSPVHGVSLLSLMRKSETAAVIVYASWTDHPLLLLAIPFGRIIMGGARGIALGLEVGLYTRIVRSLTGVDPNLEVEQTETEDEPADA